MDPISDMLIMLKNAGNAGHAVVVVPFSNLKRTIADCLLEEKYLKRVEKKTKRGFPVLEIELAYEDNEPRISSVKRVSKPSCRVYMGVKNIHSIKNGHGRLILSTPKGIMTDKTARKELVGGEALFEIW